MLASSTPDALWASPSARLVRPAAVECREVTRQPLLRRCSFRVAPGVRLLIVGEPDESASLLVRVLAGLARPSSGRVVVAGIEGPEAARRGARVSYLGREPGIHGWMTPREAVGLAASLLGLDAPDAARRTADALAWVQIDEQDLDRAVRRGGPALAQRVGLARNRSKLWQSLNRLDTFGVAHFHATDVLTVRLWLPALTLRQLDRLPADMADRYRRVTSVSA